MKIIFSDDLKSRLIHASANGSAIARDILAELRKKSEHSEIIRGNANYFTTKRIKQPNSEPVKMKIMFTVCTKELSNPNFPDRDNPQAPWFAENRTEIEASTFIGYFKNLPEYAKEELDFFINAICVNSKITVKIYEKMNDFYEAYLGDNYLNYIQPGESSLHNSCMRYETTARNAADFYVNFAGAKIIIAKDAENNIVGRAIVWQKAILHEKEVSVLDRVYFTHTFVIKLIYRYAQKIGVHLRKTKNDSSSQYDFISLNKIETLGIDMNEEQYDCRLIVKVPAKKWHKEGAPHLDTFYNIAMSSKYGLVLSNSSALDGIFATCRSTEGYAQANNSFCPNCGSIHDNKDVICYKCQSEHFTETEFGKIMQSKPVTYKNEIFPAFLFTKGKPNPYLKMYLQTRKLFAE